MVIMLTNSMLSGLSKTTLKNSSGSLVTRTSTVISEPKMINNKRNLLNFMMSLRSGLCGGVRVRLGKIGELINTACVESLDFLLNPAKGDVDDVLGILRESYPHSPSGKLFLSEKATSHSSFEPSRRRTVRRKFSSDGSNDNRSGSGSKSPLTSPWGMDDEEDGGLSRSEVLSGANVTIEEESSMDGFKLKAHEDMPPKLDLSHGGGSSSGNNNSNGISGVGGGGGGPNHSLEIGSKNIPSSPARGMPSNRVVAAFKEDAAYYSEQTQFKSLEAEIQGRPLTRARSYSFDTSPNLSTRDLSCNLDNLNQVHSDSPKNESRAETCNFDTGKNYSSKGHVRVSSVEFGVGIPELPKGHVSHNSCGNSEGFSEFPNSSNTINEAILTLTLQDPSHMPSALQLLSASTNLYDQIDLLHYLHSCKGPDFVIEKMGAVSELLEEVYVKAMQLKLWSIVRQAAGLLHKVVNSLAINVTDLLIRQKPVTVGFGSQEYMIVTPTSPNALADIIYKHW